MQTRATFVLAVAAMVFLTFGACASRKPAWAIALHGGAGTLDRDAPPAELEAYRESLRRALAVGKERAARGDAAMDVAEAVVRVLEDDERFNAGRGAAFNEKGEHELDASIMDGATLRCGAVAGVRTVKNPVSLARMVMTQTRHVLLMGDGAEQFADAMGVERVPNSYFSTPKRRQMLEEVLRERGARSDAAPGDVRHTYSTVGCVVRDVHGNLAAATSTGGLTGKRFGRVGDTPIVGAGTYADAGVAVSCTGTGEEFIRHGVARMVAARVQLAGQSLEQASRSVVFDTLKKDDGGIIAVDRDGVIVMMYNSEGMYRAAADSTGQAWVGVFEEEVR
ncbi:MAG: isoaspartyl peptidase/L-asparaginase family protein [Phycisphaerae bacterium]|jgi:beta-aspartyl-peptidase (threonine type)